MQSVLDAKWFLTCTYVLLLVMWLGLEPKRTLQRERSPPFTLGIIFYVQQSVWTRGYVSYILTPGMDKNAVAVECHY